MRARRGIRLARTLLACALLALLATPKTARAEEAGITWDRLWGNTALDTMQKIVEADEAFPAKGGGTVVVATTASYKDALAASGLAGLGDAPVLITPPDRLATQTKMQIERLRPGRILLVGGPVAIRPQVEDQLASLCGDVQRIYGTNAAETSVAVHAAATGWSKTAVVATGNSYKDALSIAPYSYAAHAPLFLTTASRRAADTRLTSSAIAALKAGGFERVIIVGGELAVPPAVERQVRALGLAVTRLWGQDAIQTSAQVALWELGQGMQAQRMGVATGGGFKDALTGAALCGRNNAVLVLTTPRRYAAIDAVLKEHATQMTCGHVFGGTAAVPDETLRHLRGQDGAPGPLHVDGARLVDAEGNVVQLRGVSTHGLAWFPSYVNEACFAELAQTWNARVVRLALYTAEYGGYCSGGDQAALRSLVRAGIAHATKAGLYVIVDWHILSDGNPLTHVREAKAFFATVAKEFGTQGNVIYEICNEPNGSCTWADIKSYAKQVIPTIRSYDADAVIIVGTPTWSQEVDKPLADPLPYDNVMYALHFYAATHTDDLRNRMVRCAQAGLPIFVSEFGICDASGNGAIDEAQADRWVATMNSLDISYCMWSLCNKAESASILKSGCTKTSGFGQADLTQAGAWLYRTLTQDRSYAQLPTGGGSGSNPSGGGESPSGGQGTWTPSVATGTSWQVAQGPLTATVRLANSWPSGAKTCYQYDVSIANSSAQPLEDWQLTLAFARDVSSLDNAWNASASLAGPRTLSLQGLSYNAQVAAGATVEGIGLIVTADAGLSLAP